MKKRLKNVFSLLLVLLTIVSLGVPCQTVLANDGRVAHTGIIVFYSISDAWDYAQDNKENASITLDADWELSSYLELAEGKSATLRMNGHKIYRNLSSAVENGYIFKVNKNATLNLEGRDKPNTEFTYSGYYSSNGSESTTKTEMTVTSGGLITGGNSTNSTGAIYMYESSHLNLNNIAINGNGAFISSWGRSYGGAILSVGDNSTITMTKTHIDHNYAGKCGGGISLYSNNNTITMTDSSVDYNLAADEDENSYGGGIHSGGNNTTISLTNSSISHNFGTSGGGGVYSAGSNLTLNMDNSHIDSNLVNNGCGGGVYANTVKINGQNNSTISSNSIRIDSVVTSKNRDYLGAGLYINENASESDRNLVKGITFDSNSVYFEQQASPTNVENGLGGGIYIWGNYTTVEDCYISNNGAYAGGGIYTIGRDTLIKNSTITGNDTNIGASTGKGAGIYVHPGESLYFTSNLYLEGKVIVQGNQDSYLKNNNIYLAVATKTVDDVEYTFTSYLKGSVDLGSDVGISMPHTNDHKVARSLESYVASAYKLDNYDGYYLDYISSSKELWQRVGTKTYAVTINGYEAGKYKQQDNITVNIDSIKDSIVTDKTEGEDVSQTRVFKDITSDDLSSITKSGSIVQFEMPNSDVAMTATFVTRTKDFTLTVDKPTTGESFPSTGTLTWTYGGETQSLKVPVYWVKEGSQKQETGEVKFNTKYAVVASIGQDVTKDLAFSYDITNANILVKYGENDASASSIAQVDKSTGTLNTKGTDILSVSKIVSVQTKRYDIRKNTTVENLRIKLRSIYNATVTLPDGSTTEVMLDNENISIPDSMITDGKVTSSGTVTIPIKADSLAEKNLTNPDQLTCSVNVELYNAWTAGAPTLDKDSGTYIGTSLDITASLGDNATTLYYRINNGDVITATSTTITLSLEEGEDSKEFTITAWDGDPNISQLQDSDAIERTYTLQREEIPASSTIISVQPVTVQIAEGSTADELRAVIPTTASATVRETIGEQTEDKTISVDVNSADITYAVNYMLTNDVVDYAKSGSSFGIKIVAPTDMSVADGVVFNVTINVTKKKEIVATPVITASGTESKLTLEAACATEGATIMYKIGTGDSDPVETYSAPITLTVRKGETESTYSIAFWAEKEGYESSDVASGIYTVKKDTTPEEITVTVTCKDTRNDDYTTLKTETYTYDKGASVKLIAPPVTGEKFEKWIKSDGTEVTDSSIDLGSLDSDTTVTAIYNPIITELDLSMSVPETNKALVKEITNVSAKVYITDSTQQSGYLEEVDLTAYFKDNNMTWVPNHSVAEPLTTYFARVPLTSSGTKDSKKNYVLAENLSVKINNGVSDAKVSLVYENEGVVAYVAFPKTGKLPVQKIQPLETLKVSYVDAYDMQTRQDETSTTENLWDLPTSALLVIDEASKYTIAADITWSIPQRGFDKTNPDAQTFTVTGTLDIPEYIDLGTLENTIELTVQVSAKEKLSTPKSSIPTGKYSSTQTVTLTSSKQDATLYYTTDGSDPTVDSTKYTGAFDVKETTTIKVFAVRDGMYDSDIGTYTITIVPADKSDSSSETKKSSGGWDDGGPFTTDTCGNVFDRWGNKIYEAKACNVGGYNLVGTSTKD